MKLQSRLRVRVCGRTNLEHRRLGSIGSPIVGRAYGRTRIIFFRYADNIDPTCNCIDTSTNQTTTPSPPAPASTAAADLCTATPTPLHRGERHQVVRLRQATSSTQHGVDTASPRGTPLSDTSSTRRRDAIADTSSPRSSSTGSSSTFSSTHRRLVHKMDT